MLTLAATFTLYGALYGPWDADVIRAGWMIWAAVSTLPYAVAGLYARANKYGRARTAWTAAFVSPVAEKAAIFGIGALFVAAGGDGDGNGIVTAEAVFGFVRAEALPYFTPAYCLWGTLLGACCFMAAYAWPKRGTEGN